MDSKAKAQMAGRMLGDIARMMDTVSRYMEQENLNLENYPQNWNSFDEMSGELRNVLVWSEDDDSVQEEVR